MWFISSLHWGMNDYSIKYFSAWDLFLTFLNASLFINIVICAIYLPSNEAEIMI
jgi:drug/metabolite transporter (DMT)-like permease